MMRWESEVGTFRDTLEGHCDVALFQNSNAKQYWSSDKLYFLREFESKVKLNHNAPLSVICAQLSKLRPQVIAATQSFLYHSPATDIQNTISSNGSDESIRKG